MKSSQMVRNGIFNGVAFQIDSLIDRLGDEIEEEQRIIQSKEQEVMQMELIEMKLIKKLQNT